MKHARPSIAITTGDPGGIGPEVAVKALADPALRGRARCLVLGPAGEFEAAARAAGIPTFWTVLPAAGRALPGEGVTVLDDPVAAAPAAANAESGAASFRWVERAISMAMAAPADALHVDAIVTGPISKEAWALAGHGDFPGHTELLAERTGAAQHGMMFVGPRLRVILATAHVPLMQVAGCLTVERVAQTVELGAAACRRLGIARPRIAVCGLNPHAGENGLLGDEDRRVIAPAIARAVAAGIDAGGPYPADAVFSAAVAGRYDLVVAMYHDQGLIPAKVLDRDRTVNVTVGLPIIRTSPDHGTAFDIAGRNRAEDGSMKAAIDLAIRMTGAA
ncbi:MAG: 4-hydroxythreonine-4-phosphate dehydrogenase PdxA [Phycisphaerales bacterium]|nr:4-hydroxythreonine-4-phosphate dehydrogenase PdxA [Phycisphaerales bacterium]